MSHTVNTDVLVLAISAFQHLKIGKLWIAFSSGKTFRYLPAQEMAAALGTEKSSALPFMHAFSGYDTASSFGWRGKRTMKELWKMYQDFTCTFDTLGSTAGFVDGQMEVLERIVVLLCDRTSGVEKVNGARKQLFSQTGYKWMDLH